MFQNTLKRSVNLSIRSLILISLGFLSILLIAGFAGYNYFNNLTNSKIAEAASASIGNNPYTGGITFNGTPQNSGGFAGQSGTSGTSNGQGGATTGTAVGSNPYPNGIPGSSNAVYYPSTPSTTTSTPTPPTCGIGQYLDSTRTICLNMNCPAGTYLLTFGGYTSCAPCPDGTTSKEGSRQCSPISGNSTGGLNTAQTIPQPSSAFPIATTNNQILYLSEANISFSPTKLQRALSKQANLNISVSGDSRIAEGANCTFKARPYPTENNPNPVFSDFATQSYSGGQSLAIFPITSQINTNWDFEIICTNQDGTKFANNISYSFKLGASAIVTAGGQALN